MLCPLPSLLSGEPFLELGPCSQELGSLCVLPHQPSSQLSSLDSPGGPLRTLNAATVGASCPGRVRPRDVDGSLDAAFACHAAFQTRDGGPAPQGQLSVQVSSTSLCLAPSFHPTPFTSTCCACPWFPSKSGLDGLHVLLGEGVVCPRIPAQYKRGEVTVIQEVIGLFIRKMLTPTFSAL